MRHLTKYGVVPTAVFAAILLTCGLTGGAARAQSASPKSAVPEQASPAAAPADAPKLNDRQKVLADQADKLLAMATELKSQVDMTNKNILSMKVVRQAEEIEFYAHRMKDQAKK